MDVTMAAVWAVGVSGGVLITLPATLYLLILTTAAVFRLGAGRVRSTPVSHFRLAVVIPAHNEERFIARCVTSLQAGVESDVEIIVIADNCTDATAERAEQAGARVLRRQDMTRRGKGYALEFAFQSLLREDFQGILVIDADSEAQEGMVGEVRSMLSAGADGVQCRNLVRSTIDSARARVVETGFLGINVVRPLGRAALGLSAGILGNGFALSRRVLESVPYVAHSLVEDVEYHVQLVRAGYRMRFANGATVYSDLPETAAAVETQRARWEGGRMRLVSRLAPKLAGELILGRLRLLDPLLDLLTPPLALHVLALLALLALPVTAGRLYAAFAMLALTGHVMMALAAGGNLRRRLWSLVEAVPYVMWKMTMIPAVVRAARPGSAWVRTGRERGVAK